jgi:5'-nucleotidase
MKILISNDDGINAPGLLALCEELSTIAELTIVSTTEEKSGFSHAITLERPLRAEPFLVGGHFPAHVLNGTPSDCVKFGLQFLAEGRPDMVISGINLGANTGLNVHYSGTVAAATEGAMFGVLSLAVSLRSRRPDFAAAARLTRQLVPYLHERLAAEPEAPAPARLLNLNIPAKGPIRGVRVVRQSFTRFIDQFHQRQDPRGRQYYWLNGDESVQDPGVDHDEWGLKEGFATLTPLTLDLTDRTLLGQMQRWPELAFEPG